MLRPGAERIERLGGAAPVHELDGADPHRFWRVPGDEPRRTAEADRGGGDVPLAYRRLEARPVAGRLRWRSSGSSARTSRWPSTSAPRCRRTGSGSPRRCGSRCAGAARSREAFGDRPGHALFGIQQGRARSGPARRGARRRCAPSASKATRLAGWRWGEGQEAMFGVLDFAPGQLPEDRPRYLMGVGKPADIVGAVARGIDMMDCVLPSRSGRTGQAWTRRGQVNLRNARHADDPRPARRAVRMPGLRRVLARLSPPRRAIQGDRRFDAPDLAQPALLPGGHGRDADGHRGGRPRRVDRRVRGGAGSGAMSRPSDAEQVRRGAGSPGASPSAVPDPHDANGPGARASAVRERGEELGEGP